jgi:hypothetical protein
VEAAQRARALKRYQFLRSSGIVVQMETNDSASFRLYFTIKAAPADTTRVLDSLQRFYTPPGKKAYIQY